MSGSVIHVFSLTPGQEGAITLVGAKIHCDVNLTLCSSRRDLTDWQAARALNSDLTWHVAWYDVHERATSLGVVQGRFLNVKLRQADLHCVWDPLCPTAKKEKVKSAMDAWAEYADSVHASLASTGPDLDVEPIEDEHEQDGNCDEVAVLTESEATADLFFSDGGEEDGDAHVSIGVRVSGLFAADLLFTASSCSCSKH